RRPAAPAPGPGLRGGEAVPAPQLALALAPGQRAGARAGGQRPQALLERDEQAPARDGYDCAGPGLAALGPVAALVAVLPGLLHLGRHQRDPAQHHRRTRPRPPPLTWQSARLAKGSQPLGIFHRFTPAYAERVG